MKLYLLSQDVNKGYDTFDSCVVAANNPEDAVTIHPRGKDYIVGDDGDYAWCSVEDVKCELVGTAIRGTERGVICSSFNAG